jgi:hypothetical protein
MPLCTDKLLITALQMWGFLPKTGNKNAWKNALIRRIPNLFIIVLNIFVDFIAETRKMCAICIIKHLVHDYCNILVHTT